MANTVNVDVTELRTFFDKMGNASADFKAEMSTWMDAVGVEFLRIVQDEIIRRQVMRYRLLLDSFEKGANNNIWTISDGGLTLEVGSSVEYAAYVNDGHWTIDPTKDGHFVLGDGTLARFVPGHWNEDEFIYEPGAKEGMVLKQQWVKGSHYFDSALRILDAMFPDLIEAKMQEWLDKYF